MEGKYRRAYPWGTLPENDEKGNRDRHIDVLVTKNAYFRGAPPHEGDTRKAKKESA